MSAKSNTKSAIISFITTVIILGGLVLVYFGISARMKDTVEPKYDKANEALSLNLETSYPQSPAAVTKHYYDLYMCIYSGEYIERTSDLVWQMRGLFTQELQILNPFEIQKERTVEEVVKMQKQGLSILSYEITDIYEDTANDTISYVDVTEYWTGAQKASKKYALVEEDNRWKIHRLDFIDDNGNIIEEDNIGNE